MWISKRMLLPALLLALCGNAAFGEALDPSAYTLEEQDKVTDAAGVSSWLAVLHLHMPDLRIPLMPEDTMAGTGKAIDRDTLHAEWLVSEEILWVSWMTTPCAGDGAYVFSAHVLVDVLATCNKEVCRQSLLAGYNQGGKNRMTAEVHFVGEGERERGRFVIKRHMVYDFSCDGFTEAAPLAVTLGDGRILRQVRLAEEALFGYSRVAEYFTEKDTSSWIKLSDPPLFGMEVPEYRDKKVNLEELTDFFARMSSNPAYLTGIPRLRYGRQTEQSGTSLVPALPRQAATQEEQTRKGLLEKNPGIETWPAMTGLIGIPYGVTPSDFTREYDLPEPARTVKDNSSFEATLPAPASWLDHVPADVSVPCTFEGIVGDGLRIGMDLQFTGAAVAGSYWYEKYRKPIRVRGERTGEQIRLEEFDDAGAVTGRFSGAFEGTTRIEGDWTSGDGTRVLPFAAGIWDLPEKPDAGQAPATAPCPIPHEIVKREIESKSPAHGHYQFELAFPGQQEAIPLARLCEKRDDPYAFERAGLDRESVIVKALTDTLLQVTWQTLSQGQGINSNWCTLLLLKTAQGWRPIFSDAILQAVYRNNIEDNSSVSLGFDMRPGAGLFLVRQSSNNYGNHDGPYGCISVSQRQEWPCTLEEDRLTVNPGREYLRLDEPEGVLIWKLEHFFLRTDTCDYEDVPPLRTLNPALRASNTCSGVLLMNDALPPYKANPDAVTYYMDEGGACPCESGKDTW